MKKKKKERKMKQRLSVQQQQKYFRRKCSGSLERGTDQRDDQRPFLFDEKSQKREKTLAACGNDGRRESERQGVSRFREPVNFHREKMKEGERERERSKVRPGVVRGNE